MTQYGHLRWVWKLCTQGWNSRLSSGVQETESLWSRVSVTSGLIPSSSALHVTVPHTSHTSGTPFLSYCKTNAWLKKVQWNCNKKIFCCGKIQNSAVGTVKSTWTARIVSFISKCNAAFPLKCEGFHAGCWKTVFKFVSENSNWPLCKNASKDNRSVTFWPGW